MRKLLIFLLLSATAIAQTGAFYTDRGLGVNPFSSTNTAGSTPSPIFLSYAWVRVCSLPTANSPCNTPAAITDIFGNPLSIIGGNFGQLQTDVVGRFSFGCTPGNYQIQIAVTSSNTPQLSYPITCPANTGLLTANNTWTGTNIFNGNVTVNGTLTITGLSPNSLVCTNGSSALTTTCGVFALGTINGIAFNLGGVINVNAGSPAHSVALNEGNGSLINGLILGADTIPVGKAAADPAASTLPSCPDTNGNHLNYALGGTFTCGTSSSILPSGNAPTRVTLGGAVAMSATTQTNILSTAFTTPAVTGNYRLLFNYVVWLTVGANLCAAEVIDTTNSRVFAASGQNANGTGYIGLSGSEVSTQTYPANTTITVHLDAECNNAAGGLVGATVNMNGGAIFTMSPAEPTFLAITPILTN